MRDTPRGVRVVQLAHSGSSRRAFLRVPPLCVRRCLASRAHHRPSGTARMQGFRFECVQSCCTNTLGRTTLSGFWHQIPLSPVKMLKTWYVVHFLVPTRHTCAPQVSWFFRLSGIRYLESQVCSQLPAACLRTHSWCLAGGMLPGWFGLVFGRFMAV